MLNFQFDLHFFTIVLYMNVQIYKMDACRNFPTHKFRNLTFVFNCNSTIFTFLVDLHVFYTFPNTIHKINLSKIVFEKIFLKHNIQIFTGSCRIRSKSVSRPHNKET